MVHTENITQTWAAWIKLDKTQQAEAAGDHENLS